MTLIGRSALIIGADNDEWHRNGLGHCDAEPPVTANTAITRTEVQALDTTAVDLVSPNHGKRLVPVGVYYSKASGAYVDGADVTIQFKDAANTLVATIDASEMNSASAESGWATRATLAGTPDTQPLPIEGLEIVTSVAFTGAGGALEIDVIYFEVEEEQQ